MKKLVQLLTLAIVSLSISPAWSAIRQETPIMEDAPVAAELSDDLELLTELFPSPEARESEGLQTLNRSALSAPGDLDYRKLYHPVLRVPEPFPVDLILRVHKDPGKGKLQRMDVIDMRGDEPVTMVSYKVTTGKPGRKVRLKNGTIAVSAETPSGWFTIHFTAKMAESMAYDWSKMPHSLFFAAGKRRNSFGIHGHYDVTGYRGSGGCVRMRKVDAAALWVTVHKIGIKNDAGEFTNILVNIL